MHRLCGLRNPSLHETGFTNCKVKFYTPVEPAEAVSPIKLVVIAILLYIGYRLLTSGKKKDQAERPSSLTEEDSPPVVDVLVEDPVCHKLVPKKQAIRLQHKENIVYFCSEACCNRFISKEGEKE